MDNGGELSLSFQWLKCGHLKMHTECGGCTRQGKAVQNRIYGMPAPLNCRVYSMLPDMWSSCTPLAATVYQTHDRIVHWSLLKCFNQPVSCEYWKHVPSAMVSRAQP